MCPVGWGGAFIEMLKEDFIAWYKKSYQKVVLTVLLVILAACLFRYM